MAKLIKIFIGLVFALVLLLVGVIVALTQWVSPNDFKPQIEALSAQQGYPLRIEGSLDWQFFPSFGISIGKTRLLSNTTSEKTLVSIEHAVAEVAVMPLLKREVTVETLLLEGLDAQLIQDASGKGNWETLGKASEKTAEPNMDTEATAKTPSSSATQGLPFALEVSEIAIRDGQLSFANPSEQQSYSLRALTVEMLNVNLENAWFPLSVSFTADVQQPDLNLTLNSHLKTRLKVDSSLNKLTIDQSQWVTHSGSSEQAGSSDSTALKGSSNALTLSFSGELDKLQQSPSWTINLDLLPFNAQQWLQTLGLPLPEMRDPNKLQHVALSLTSQGTLDHLTVKPITISLDTTEIRAEASLIDSNHLNLALSGDTLNLDDYLPPPAEIEDAQESAPSSPSSAPVPDDSDPFSALRLFSANLDLTWQTLIVNQLTLTDLKLDVSNTEGLATIKQLSTDFYQGSMALQGKLDARNPKATLSLDGEVNDIQLNPLMQDMIDNPNIRRFALEGAAHSTLTVKSHGDTVTELVDNLDAVFTADTKALQLAPVNIQRYVCQAAALLSGKKAPQYAWSKTTQLQDVKAVIHLQDGVANIDTFRAGVENFLLSSLGSFNVKTLDFDIRLPFTLLKLAQQPKGCLKPNARLLNRSLSLLRCKGSAEAPKCALDYETIREESKKLIQKRLQKQLEPEKKKVEEKIEKEKDRLKNKLENKLNDALGDDTKDRLKGLFGL